MLPAAPYWLDKPTNLVLAPEENGRLVCRANGNPKPSIQWLLNGQPIDSMDNVTLLLFSSPGHIRPYHRPSKAYYGLLCSVMSQ